MAEITRLGVALGANPLTYSGLSGVGDLIVTGTSVHSRNWRAGDALGRGESLADIEANMGMVIEGISTTRAAYELAQELGVYMPITGLFTESSTKVSISKEALTDIMSNEFKARKRMVVDPYRKEHHGNKKSEKQSSLPLDWELASSQPLRPCQRKCCQS